ncbi:flavodoxin domain-containing protein [Solirhodobacter olei]|uniref:flavodoxin domain-containing protein n=1 Tax=Solirhodobacter olei TaxID=2493082 RepID=UPI000FDBF562|nr:flavodoxin domain-containing protein [Solirhodobacter olei]
MKVLILFATVEGQTGKIARFAEGEVSAAGHEPVLVDAADAGVPLSFDGVSAVILAAPVHERRHPERFETILATHRAELAASRTLLLSVSLSAAFPEGREEAEDYVTELSMRTGFRPGAVMLVPGAVRMDRYDYYATQVLRHVVLRGHAYDPNVESHEFTDWAALGAKIGAFLKG